MASKKPQVRKPRFELVEDIDAGSLIVDRLYDEAMPAASSPKQAEEPGMLRSLADSGLALGSGAVTGVKMISDAFGADNAVSRTLGDVGQGMQGLLSPYRQAEVQERQRLIAEAEASGSTLNEIGAYLGGFAEAPVDTLLNAAGTMAPTMAAMLVPGAREARLAAMLGTGVGAVQGAGAGKSSIYDAVLQRSIQEGKTEEEARALADEAQAYGGKNTDTILANAALGGVAGGSGLERVARGLKFGAQAGQAVPGMARRVGTGALAEGIPEAGQGGLEQLSGNVALQREGYDDVPTMRGVAGSAALEGVAGGALGGGFGIPTPSPAAPIVPESGPLTRAANAGAAVQPPAPEPIPLTDEQTQALLDLANRRRDELDTKAKGTKEQKVQGPDGKPITIPGQPGQYLTPDEQEERKFLDANGGDAQQLARVYDLPASERPDPETGEVAPPAVAPVEVAATAVAPVEPPAASAGPAFSSLDEADDYVNAQIKRGGAAFGVPIEQDDGTIGLVPKGDPRYTQAVKDRLARRKARNGAANVRPGQPVEPEPADAGAVPGDPGALAQPAADESGGAAGAGPSVGAADDGAGPSATGRGSGDDALTGQDQTAILPVDREKPAANTDARDDWTRAAENDRWGILVASGWKGADPSKPSLSAQRMVRLSWDKMSDSQRNRISQGIATRFATNAQATPEGTGTQAPQAPATEAGAAAGGDAARADQQPVEAGARGAEVEANGVKGERAPDDKELSDAWDEMSHESRASALAAADPTLFTATGRVSADAKRMAVVRWGQLTPALRNKAAQYVGLRTQQQPAKESKAPREAREAEERRQLSNRKDGSAPVEADGVAAEESNAAWWKSLTPFGRRQVIQAAGLKLPDAVTWTNLTTANREKLLARKDAVQLDAVDAAPALREKQPAQANQQDRVRDARALGKKAAESGQPRNPPTAFTSLEKQVWRAGWDEAQATKGATPQVPVEPAKREAFEHAGLKVYPTRFKSGDRIVEGWAVQSPENKGTDKVLGDTLHETVEAAKKDAELLARQAADRAETRAKIDAQEKAEAAEREAKKEANKGKSLLERRAEAVLDKEVRDGETGEVTTRRAWVAKKVAEGLKPKVEQEDKIKPMSRAQFNRASNEEQRAHERKVKEAGKKDTYWLGDYSVTKIEYDYAKSLEAGGVTEAAKPAKENKAQREAREAEERRQLSNRKDGSAPVEADGLTAKIERAKRRLRENRNKQATTGVREELAKLKTQEQDIEREIRSLRQQAVADEPAADQVEKSLSEIASLVKNRIDQRTGKYQHIDMLMFNEAVAKAKTAGVKASSRPPGSSGTIVWSFEKPDGQGYTAYIESSGKGTWMSVPNAPAAESTATPASAPAPSANTVFTEDAAAAARARLKAKLNGGNKQRGGIDPEVFSDGVILAGYHIEKGARKFAAYVKAMLEDMGDSVKPYLKAWYMGVKFDPRGAGLEGMDSAADVEAADVDAIASQELKQPAQPPAAPPQDDKPKLDGSNGRRAVAQSVADHLIGGNKFATIVEARKFIAELTGQKIEPGTRLAKLADETVEMGVAMVARDIVRAARKQGRSDEVIYQRLVALSEAQPSLNVRDSDSIREQAYSTPVPLAFVASRLAQIQPGQKVGEPTAGNGMLVMEVDYKDATLNELNSARRDNLEVMGFDGVNNKNAAGHALAPAKSLDAVVMNPPFGVVRDDDGKTVTYTVMPNYTTGEIDHAIVFKALEAMKDDGNAVLIIGGTLAESDEGRRDAYRGKSKREFFYNLHQQYNVVDHFTVGGDLYKKQGTTYPVDVIVIRGRGKSSLGLPAANLPPIIETWAQLKEKLNAKFDGLGARGDGDAGSDRGQGGNAADDSRVPEPAGLPPQGAGAEGQPGGTGAGIRNADAGGTDGSADRPGSGRDAAAVGEPGDAGAASGSGRAGTAAGTDSAQQPGGGERDGGNPAGVGDGNGRPADRARLSEEDAGKLQAKYTNFSQNKSVNTLVATNHLSALESAFARLRERVGNIDDYVRSKLQYDEAGFKRAFSAEQVEALALAIDNIEQGRGFIIGDQTGIGKGRVVAAMIRYAKLNGKTPVFVTQMPDLYGDMMRDLNDIGMQDFKPLMTNNNATVPLDADALAWFGEVQGINTRIAELEQAITELVLAEQAGKDLSADALAVEVRKAMKASANPEIVSLRDEIAELRESRPVKRGKFLETPNIKQHEKTLADIVASGSIGDYGAIFTTYNQMAALDSGKPRRDKDGNKVAPKPAEFAYRDTFLRSMVDGNAMVILDESHNAGEAGDGKFPKVGDVVRALVGKAGGVFYSSATFAKNPAVMDVYSRTDLGLAFESQAALAEAINSVPLQQVASAMLVEAGQYIRRERSFDGIEYKIDTVEASTQAAEDVATAMRLTVEFDEAKQGALNDIQANLDAEGAVIASTGGGGSAGAVESTNFTSVMHNVINTFLLALKADAAADAAIAAIQAGEKPVLTVANTMEMFITEYARSEGLAMGDALNATFADVLMRYLEKTRMARIRHANGTEETVRLSDKELGPDAVAVFESAREFIASLKLDIPLSPIDHIKERIQAAGYSIGEITGRQTVVADGALKPRNKAELNTAGKKNTIAKFNGGQIDALIINRSGSTGLSMHASETFADQRRRVMVIAQAELDINNHMQMLGRINRTGQVTAAPAKLPKGPAAYGLPRYVQLTANVPIELRPAAVLAAKMASLSANTTAGRKSAVEDSSAPDFMNKYGDQVAALVISNDPDLNIRLGRPIKLDEDGVPSSSNAIARVTGRIGLLPLREQTAIYDRIASEYRDLIAQLDALGKNDLEAKTYPLDAKTLEQEEVIAGEGDSPFQAPVIAEKVDVRKLGKPFESAKVRELIEQGLEGKTSDQHYRDLLDGFNADLRNEITALTLEAQADPKAGAVIDRRKEAMKAAAARFREVAPRLGQPVVIKTNEGNVYGVPVAIERKKGAKSVAALSSWRVKYAVVDGARMMTFPLSQVYSDNTKGAAESSVVIQPAATMHVANAERTGFDQVPVMEAFDRGQTGSRETRTVLTGNLLRAGGRFPGRLISYTTSDGTVRQGLMTPATFDLSAAKAKLTPVLKDADQMVDFLDRGGVIVDRETGGEILKIRKTHRYEVTTAKTGKGKAIATQGGLYMVSSGSKMRANLYASEAAVLNDFLRKVSGGMNVALTTTSETKDLIAGEAKFSRRSTGRGLPMRDAQAAADLIRAQLPGAPDIILLDRVDDAPPGLAAQIKAKGAAGDVEAAYWEGKIYAFPGNFESLDRFIFVVGRHEVRHAGLDAMLGDQKDATMVSIGRANRRMMLEARKLMADGLADSFAEGVEEALADMPVEDIAALSRIQVMVAAIRRWLRATAFKLRKAGWRKLADSLEPRTWSDNDVIAFVMKAEDVSRGPRGGGGARFSRAKTVTNDDGHPEFEFDGIKLAFPIPTDRIEVIPVDGQQVLSYAVMPAQGFDVLGHVDVLLEDGRPVSLLDIVVYKKGNGVGGKAVEALLRAYPDQDLNISNIVPEAQGFWERMGVPTQNLEEGAAYDGTLNIETFLDAQESRSAQARAGRAGGQGQGANTGAARRAFGAVQAGQGGQGPAVARFSRPRTLDNVREAAFRNLAAFDVQGASKGTWGHYRGMLMQTLGRRQIVDLYSAELPQLTEYDRLVQQMDAEKNESSAEADRLASDWAKLDKVTGRKGEELRLADLMHDATLAQIDPDNELVDGDDPAKQKSLRAAFEALSPEAVAVYRQARGMYAQHYEKVRAAIQDRIQRSELSSSRKKEMMAKMDDDFFKKVKGVYFPLARFGNYVMVTKNAAGDVVNVTRAETLNEAQTARRQVLEAFPKEQGFATTKVMKDAEFNPGRDAVGKGFMADLFETLDAQGVDEALRDSVSQLYLSALPDLSWAKHGIHRKGTPGYSQDARRAFAQNMFHGARYLAKLRYSDRMQVQLEAMQTHIKANEADDGYDGVQAQQVVDEMVKRHESMMNPKASSLSTALTSIGFVFHLGLSPASAMVNLSQTALVAYPIMGAKWGFGRSGAALLKASREVTGAKNDLAKHLRGEEADAFNKAVQDGTIDVTMAHDLAGISQGEDQKVVWAMRPVMRAASFMFHHAERFNRQVTFLAAYRLSRESGKSPELAYEEAKRATYDGHYDYSASNRPRLMQGNWQKVIFLFKQYAQNMIYTLSRNAYLSVKALDPAQRAEARKALAGILSAHAAAAGVLGLPLVGPLLAAASFLGGDDDEPWDAEVAMQNVFADAFGPKAAEVMARGFSRLTPFDLSGRVALNKLILPDVQEGLEGQRWAESFLAGAAGPVAGIFTNGIKGLQKISEGDYQRGFEDMLPSALRGPVKALRYGSEGAVDRSGVVILDDVNAAGVTSQALGFAPSEVRRATERRGAIMDYDRSLADRRSTLMRQWSAAKSAGDEAGMREMMAEIRAFNGKNPGRKITRTNLMQSHNSRNKRVAEAKDGVYLPKTRRDAAEAVRF